MTPFMLQVQALLDGEPTSDPATEPSRAESVAEATDTQVLIRSLAEQLVSEANAVLAGHAEAGNRHLTLVDEAGPGALAFTLGYGARSARVQTVVSGHAGTAQLVIPDAPAANPCRLAGEDQLEHLLLTLIAPRPA